MSEALDAATWLETTRELRRLGWQVTLLAAGPAGQQSVRGVDILCLSRPEVYFVRQLVYHLKVLWLVVRLRPAPDVVLFGQASALWLLPLRTVRSVLGRRRPLLVMDSRSLHMPLRRKEDWKAKLQRVYRLLMNRAGGHLADGQTAITVRMAQAMKVPSHRLWGIWPSGVNPDAFVAARTARDWPSGDMPVRLIYVGSMHYERNLRHLCLATERAHAEGLCFTLTLIGDGDERADLEHLAERTDGRICLLPAMPHEQIPAMLAKAHIGVLPFPDEEKFRVSSPVKLFEYLAAGLPILATRIACHVDVLGDAGCVFWADGSDVEGLLAALRLAWQGRARLSQMGAQAAAVAPGWTWRASATQLKTALETGLECPIAAGRHRDQ